MTSRCRAKALLAAWVMSFAIAVAQTVHPGIPRMQELRAVIDVDEPRPLWFALDQLENVIHFPVNYEDPPWASASDLQTITPPRCPTCQTIGPRTGHVTASIEKPLAGTASEADALFDVNLLLISYRLNSLSGEFQTEQANGMIYVTPTTVRGADGVIRPVTSPLLTKITIPYDRGRVTETVQAILNAVTAATGLRFGIGGIPFLPPDMANFSATNITARDALANLFSQASALPITYRLIFDPDPTPKKFDYIINIHVAGGIPQAPVRAPPPPPPPPPPSGPRPGQGKPLP